MNKHGYTLLEALFAFFIVSLLSFSTLPVMHELENTYDETKETLELKRTLYFYLTENFPKGRMQLDHYAIYRTHEDVCITNLQSHTVYCHPLKRLYHD